MKIRYPLFAAETGTGTGGVVPPVVPPAGGNPWYHGADAETVGHITTKGWHTKPAGEVALAAIKSHREAEQMIGVPSDQILRLPKDAADEAGWKNVWTRLGVPADAKDYDLTTVKRGDQPLDDALASFIRTTAAALHLPKDQAPLLAQAIVKDLDAKDTEATAVRTARLTEEKATLDKSWGPNKEANKFVATQAAKALGVDPETVQALENQIGYAKVMEMFRAIGAKIGEDKFVTADNGNAGRGVMTREQATAKKGELMRDLAWTQRYLAGGHAEVREMTALNTLISAA